MHRVRFAPRRGRRRRAALIETTRPELIPACVALLAHPDDERHARARRQRGADAAVRHARAGADAPAGRARQGHGPGDGVHVRRPHRRDVVARARAAGALGARARRAPASRCRGATPGWESRGPRARARELRASCRAARSTRRAGASSSCSSESGELVGEPQPVTRAVKFFEKGERPVEIVTSRQWFIRTIEHRDALIARGRELQLAPAVHARALRGLGQRADAATGASAASASSACRSRCGTRSTQTAPSSTTSRSPRARSSSRSTPRPTCPTATTPPSAGSRAASSATPT